MNWGAAPRTHALVFMITFNYKWCQATLIAFKNKTTGGKGTIGSCQLFSPYYYYYIMHSKHILAVWKKYHVVEF